MKLSVHAVPHQSFLAIGSEVPIAKKSSFPPGEAKGGLYGFALVHSKWYSAYRRKPLRRDAPPQLCIKQLYAIL